MIVVTTTPTSTTDNIRLAHDAYVLRINIKSDKYPNGHFQFSIAIQNYTKPS